MKDQLIKTIKSQAAKGISVSTKGIIAFGTPNKEGFQAIYGDVSKIDYYVKKGRIVFLRWNADNPSKWHCVLGPEITETTVPETNVAFYSYDQKLIDTIEEAIQKATKSNQI